MFLGLVTGAGYKANIQAEYPYDVAVAIDAVVADFHEVLEFIGAESPVKDFVSYYLYHDPSVPMEILALSDYNRLREQIGLEKQSLAENQYLIHCSGLIKENQTGSAADGRITLSETQLVSHAGLVSNPWNRRMVGTQGRAMVVPDQVAFLGSGAVTAGSHLADGGEPALRVS